VGVFVPEAKRAPVSAYEVDQTYEFIGREEKVTDRAMCLEAAKEGAGGYINLHVFVSAM